MSLSRARRTFRLNPDSCGNTILIIIIMKDLYQAHAVPHVFQSCRAFELVSQFHSKLSTEHCLLYYRVRRTSGL